MRQYKLEKIPKLEKVICNKCGKEIAVQGQVVQGDVLSVEKRWGYFSERDNEVHRFDLCESCYNELIATFQIPIEIE